jgi:hypothetical protein
MHQMAHIFEGQKEVISCLEIFWTHVDMFLHVLNQQDLTAAIQSDTVIFGNYEE